MARGAAAETNPSVWRYWAARLTLQRAILQERFSDLQGKRDRVQKRAVAAEIIAHEANAARLRALLDAAREQATVKTIESAEQRIAAARGDWEAAHDAFSPPDEPDTHIAKDQLALPVPSRDWSTRLAGELGIKVSKRVPFSAVFAGVLGIAVVATIAVYLHRDQDVTAGAEIEARRPAPLSDTAAIVPAAPVAASKPVDMPAVVPADIPPPAASGGKEAPSPLRPVAGKPTAIEAENTAVVEKIAPPPKAMRAPPKAMPAPPKAVSAPANAVAVAMPEQPKTHVRAPSAASLTAAPTPGRNPFREEVAPPPPPPQIAPVEDGFPYPRLYAD